MKTVCYESHVDKRRKYVAETLPAVFAAAVQGMQADTINWLRDATAGADDVARLRNLHESVRCGRYITEDGPCDHVRTVRQTIAQGGDCEDWAAVLLAGCALRRIEAVAVTTGDYADPFRHIAVAAKAGGRWYLLDPKGDQAGVEFNVRSDRYPLLNYWRSADGAAVAVPAGELTSEVAGSGRADVAPVRTAADLARPLELIAGDLLLPPKVSGSGNSSANPLSLLNLSGNGMGTLERRGIENRALPALPAGADTSPLNTWGDFYRLLDEPSQVLFFKAFNQFGFSRTAMPKLLPELRGKLSAGTAGLTRGAVLHFVRESARYDAAQFRWLLGSNAAVAREMARLDPTQQAETVNSLEDVNLSLAARWADSMLEPGDGQAERVKALRDYALAVGGNPAASNEQLAAVAAATAAANFTAQGIWLDDAMEQVQARGADDAAAVIEGLTGSAFVQGSGLSKFIKRVGAVLQRVFVREPGRAIRNLAKQILNADKSAPWLSQFVLRPLGFMLQAQVLYQVGNMMVAGKASAFDSEAVVAETSATMISAGQVLLAASMFIPQPWGALAAVVGAALVAGGHVIRVMSKRHHDAMQAQADAEARAQGELLTAQANYEAQQQAQQRAEGRALGLIEAGHHAQGWVSDQSGNQFWALWVPHVPSQQWLPAWVWITDSGWQWTGLFT